jgi:hypothetical protein
MAARSNGGTSIGGSPRPRRSTVGLVDRDDFDAFHWDGRIKDGLERVIECHEF